MARQIPCPTCARPIEWSDAFPYRPFCSERCRLIDLGDWLMEKNVIPGEAAPESGPAEDDDWPPAGGQQGSA